MLYFCCSWIPSFEQPWCYTLLAHFSSSQLPYNNMPVLLTPLWDCSVIISTTLCGNMLNHMETGQTFFLLESVIKFSGSIYVTLTLFQFDLMVPKGCLVFSFKWASDCNSWYMVANSELSSILPNVEVEDFHLIWTNYPIASRQSFG